MFLPLTKLLQEGGDVSVITNSGAGNHVSLKVRFIRIFCLKSEPSGYSDAGGWPLVSDGNAIPQSMYCLLS